MRSSLFLILAVFIARFASAAEPGFASSTLTAGAGGGFRVSGEGTNSWHNGPSFVGEYEFGLHKYVAATIGVDNLLLNHDVGSRFGTFTNRERITLVPFGLRATVPLSEGRVELFAGGGGAALNSSEFYLNNPYQGSKVLVQLNGGARFALDQAQRFRIGPTVRFYRDLGRPTQEWLSLSADSSYRFGH